MSEACSLFFGVNARASYIKMHFIYSDSFVNKPASHAAAAHHTSHATRQHHCIIACALVSSFRLLLPPPPPPPHPQSPALHPRRPFYVALTGESLKLLVTQHRCNMCSKMRRRSHVPHATVGWRFPTCGRGDDDWGGDSINLLDCSATVVEMTDHAL